MGTLYRGWRRRRICYQWGSNLGPLDRMSDWLTIRPAGLVFAEVWFPGNSLLACDLNVHTVHGQSLLDKWRRASVHDLSNCATYRIAIVGTRGSSTVMHDVLDAQICAANMWCIRVYNARPLCNWISRGLRQQNHRTVPYHHVTGSWPKCATYRDCATYRVRGLSRSGCTTLYMTLYNMLTQWHVDLQHRVVHFGL